MTQNHAPTATPAVAPANGAADFVTECLRPFPADHVGKLPRITCPACSKGSCNEHKKSKCATCGAYISERHIHIDYVGHADVTRRLLTLDPEWNWEPLAVDGDGLPVFDMAGTSPVGLWIRLTVHGVSRLGYGSCPTGQNDAVKVLIGDALRNAALRFGIALDLWAKGDRSDPTTENASTSATPGQRRGSVNRSPEPAANGNGHASPDDPTVLRAQIASVAKARGIDLGAVSQEFQEAHGVAIKDATAEQLRAYHLLLTTGEVAT